MNPGDNSVSESVDSGVLWPADLSSTQPKTKTVVTPYEAKVTLNNSSKVDTKQETEALTYGETSKQPIFSLSRDNESVSGNETEKNSKLNPKLITEVTFKKNKEKVKKYNLCNICRHPVLRRELSIFSFIW